ncbi:MAG: dipeptide epimerase [Pseudomonadota bacterium]
MNYHISSVELLKRHPLAISRDVRAGSMNLFLAMTLGNQVGFGEAVPDHEQGQTVDKATCQLDTFLKTNNIDELAVQTIWQQGKEAGLIAPVQAALDMALWDLLAKKAQLPCYKLFGLTKKKLATSVTIGIMSPQQAAERTSKLLQNNCLSTLKIKLGSPQGIEADQAMFIEIKKIADKHGVKLRVDANGGWTLPKAKLMLTWLAERGVEYVEQPLNVGHEEQLLELYRKRPLPIFVDESCHFSHDIPALAESIDGINIKLMKCGGFTEALRLIATARAYGLKTMIGCMSESSLAISAACSIAPLVDYIDLDSHLNIKNDPATGSVMDKQGNLLISDDYGHGGQLHDNII